MAEQLGAKLAAVDTITEESGRHYAALRNFYGRDNPFGGEATDSIAAGMVKVTASVRVVFLLDDEEMD